MPANLVERHRRRHKAEVRSTAEIRRVDPLHAIPQGQSMGWLIELVPISLLHAKVRPFPRKMVPKLCGATNRDRLPRRRRRRERSQTSRYNFQLLHDMRGEN